MFMLEIALRRTEGFCVLHSFSITKRNKEVILWGREEREEKGELTELLYKCKWENLRSCQLELNAKYHL